MPQRETDDAARRALLAALEPWLALLLQRRPTFELQRDGCVDSPVVMTLEVDVTDSLRPDVASLLSTMQRFPMPSPPHEPLIDDKQLRKVREAIDLLSMALSLEPALLWASDRVGAPPALVQRVLDQGGALILCVTLTATLLDDSGRLERRLCRYFVESLDQKMSTNVAFRRVRSELETALGTTNPTWRQRLETHPVVLRYVITMSDSNSGGGRRVLRRGQRLPTGPVEMEDALRSLVQFIAYAGALVPTPWTRDADLSAVPKHLPVVVDRVTFSTERLLLTSRTIAVVKQLHRVRKGFAWCTRTRVDPRLIQCSSGDVTEFLHAISAGCDGEGLVVTTGSDSAGVFDHRNKDRSELCDIVLRGVAHCERLDVVHVGMMLKLCESAASRRGIYHSLIEHVLSRSLPCSVVLEGAHVGDYDAQLLREEHAKWKLENPTGTLRVKTLRLHLSDNHNTFHDAMVAILDSVDDMDVHNQCEHSAPLPHESVRTLLTKFTGLQRLVIGHAVVASMDQFLEDPRPALEHLVLRDCRLRDRESFARFVRTLGESTTNNPRRSSLARSLRTLVIDDTMERERTFVMKAEGASVLAEALTTNHVLETVEVCVSAPSEEAAAIATQLQATAGRVVRNGRGAVPERAQRVAFLSVLHAPPSRTLELFDASVVALIFALASPGVERQIAVHMRERRRRD